MSENTHSISLVGMSKQFGSVRAVENLTLDVDRGEVFGLLGPNGAGKTTTIRMLTALIAPTAGQAQVAGFRLGQQDMEIRRSVGILTESPGLYDGLSAERNLVFFARLYEVARPAEQVERYLRMLGLWGRRQEAVGTFSKGMRQKLAIARALLHEPQILFLDEPTSGLDPSAARLVREFIASLKHEGRTIVMCTHNLDEADRLCDRIGVLKAGLIAVDRPAALRHRLFGQTVVFHLGAPAAVHQAGVEQFPFVQRAEALDNKLVVTLANPLENNPLLVGHLVKAGAAIQFVGELRRSLEDVYMELVREDGIAGPEA